MEVKWSDDDTKNEYSKIQTRKARPIVKSLARLMSFGIGDVVIPTVKSKDKYLICYIDPEGMYFARKITGKKSLSTTTYCLCTAKWNYAKWQADPDLIDHILLDEEDSYDPSKAIRKDNKLKGKCRRFNKKIALKYEESKDKLAEFIKGVSIRTNGVGGSIFYEACSLIDTEPRAYNAIEQLENGSVKFEFTNRGSYNYKAYYIIKTDGTMADRWGREYRPYSQKHLYLSKPMVPKEEL